MTSKKTTRRVLTAAFASIALTGAAAPFLPTADGATTAAPVAAPDVDLTAVTGHLQQLQTIANNNGGHRRAGSAGYTASVNYVVGKLQAAGFTVTKQRCTNCAYPSDNIIADWPGGDTTKTVMFGAHLDGVASGPAANDNGSGSAAILQTALTLAAKSPTMLNHVRFAWWTDEEQGLNGSQFYVDNLSSTARSNIKAYYNFDMVASKNAGYFINNIGSTQSAPMKEYWDSLGLQPEENTEGRGRSDDYPFSSAGIPASGYAMGASARKTSTQASKWGGTSGAAFDSCYHSACDSYPANINTTALNRAADGIAYTLWKRAVNDGSSTPTDPTDPTTPAPLPTTTFTNNYRYTIYDNYTVNSRITSTKSANVTTAKVKYYISHSCIQDLSISLVAPDGRSYPLESSSYGSCTQRPASTAVEKTVTLPSSATSGTWTLRVRDNYSGDTGYLNGWSLTV